MLCLLLGMVTSAAAAVAFVRLSFSIDKMLAIYLLTIGIKVVVGLFTVFN
jgi:hypothetical protein